MPIRLHKAVVAVVEETTPYTFEAPVAGDAFPAYDITMNVEGDNWENPSTRDHYGKLAGVPGSAAMEISFKVPLSGNGAAGTAPHFGEALKGCGLSETVVGATSVTYKPSSVFTGAGDLPGTAYTCSVFMDGLRYSLKGGMGNLIIRGKSGTPVELEFKFRGAYSATTDTALLTPTGLNTTTPVAFLSAGLSVHGPFTPAFESVEIDYGNELGDIIDANDANGIKGTTIVNRVIKGSVTPEMVLVATHDYLGKWRSGATGAIEFGPIGSAGNIVAWSATLTQYQKPGFGDRNRVQTLELPFAVITAAAGADGSDCSLAFT